MITPAQKYEVCRVKIGTVIFPFYDTTDAWIDISTRTGNVKIGSTTFTTVKNTDLTIYPLSGKIDSTIISGSITAKILNGLRDVYSISLVYTGVRLNITDFEAFLKQFPNLYSLYITIEQSGNPSIINGDLVKIPDSVERVKIIHAIVANAGVDLYLNFSSFSPTSKLKYYEKTTSYNVFIKVIGDLAKAPIGISFLKISEVASTSSITYTAGKTWASAFDTLSIPLSLTTTELDNLLHDMRLSITSKVGVGVITLGGFRSAASDADVAYLQGLGFTVNIQRQYKLLDLPFQNNFTDSGEMGMTMVAGGTSNLPTFVLSGRKAGEYCAVFNGSQSIKTTANLPINSDKVTVAFWMKTTQTTLGMIAELSTNVGVNNAFYLSMNETANKIWLLDHTSTYNIGNSVSNVNGGSWIHIVATIDRSQNGTTQNKIYINGTLSYSQIGSPYNSDNSGNFVNNILFIGQRAGNTLGFVGSLTRQKIYNYPFTATEVANLYNSEL